MIQHATDPDLIRRRAYELWMQRGCPEGSPERDWLTAEQELLERTGEAAAPQALPGAITDARARRAEPAPAVPRPRRPRSITMRQLGGLSALTPPVSEAAPQSSTRARKSASGGRRAQKRSA